MLDMFSFERRCLRGDRIELYKMFSDSDYLEVGTFFNLQEGNRARGHGRKIRKQSCRLDL